MNMHKRTLASLFSEALYNIPDYQRGYAWEEKQCTDFIQDIDDLTDSKARSHYTGTIVVYSPRDAEPVQYGKLQLKTVDVVDGQQRLTSACLYLSVILKELLARKEDDYRDDISTFLHTGGICKLSPSNGCRDLFYDLLCKGRVVTPPMTYHGQRMIRAYDLFDKHIQNQLTVRGTTGTGYLKALYQAITQKMHFTFYPIEEECEIGMTFELMNSRGKDLSVLELLKNYLMHWISRNVPDQSERDSFTIHINKHWAAAYTNIAQCAGDEDQCLRIAWILICNHAPASWKGYDGFKDQQCIPIRNLDEALKQKTKEFISSFTDGLADIASYYSKVTNPTLNNTKCRDELIWLTKILQTGNVANFLPLLVAAKMQWEAGQVSQESYISLLKALECYAYRVFLYGRRRSNAGKTRFFFWAGEVFNDPTRLASIVPLVHGLTRYYVSETSFADGNSKPSNWYSNRRLLKYTLFEYELYLLEKEGKTESIRLQWRDLSDSTIEHILPQNPEEHSRWRQAWSEEDISECLHDIGNLVLTVNNANYSNFDFERKKGEPGRSPSYTDSPIKQERKIASHPDWIRPEFNKRREELIAWINDRWKTNEPDAVIQISEEDEEDNA